MAASSERPVKLFFNYCDGRMTRLFRSEDPDELKSMLDVHYLADGEAIEI